MTTNAAVTVLAAAALLAGCQGSTDPSDPPTSQDALTTTDDVAPTTGDAAPTTQPPDDVQETSSAPSDTVETTDAGGPPPMPDEAKEDSEAGAEAFALHYVDLLNYTSRHPEVGLLEPLATNGCEACDNYESTVEYSVENEERTAQDLFETSRVTPSYIPQDSAALITIATRQIGQDVVNQEGDVVETIPDRDFSLMLSLTWAAGQGWQVDQIQAVVE